jgi:hypothetical protein
VGATVAVGDAATTAVTVNHDGSSAFTLTRPTGGVSTYSCADDAGAAACRYEAGANGTVFLGNTTNAAATINTDDVDITISGTAGRVGIERSDTGSLTLSMHDYGDSADDDRPKTAT